MDQEQKEVFIKNNERLIHFIIKKHFPELNQHHPDYEDMVQQGYLALCMCANNVNPELPETTSYTYPSILRSMTKYWFHYRPGLIGGRTGTSSNEYVWFKLESLNREVEMGEGYGEFVDLLQDSQNHFERAETFYDIQKAFERKKNGKRVFDGLLKGYDATQISKVLGVSKQRVSFLIKTVEKEYLEMCENEFYGLKGRRKV